MQQAKRVVWADVRSNFPTGGRRLRAFEYVWTWCTGKCEPLLPANKVEFEVQARPQLLHRATNNGTRSSCARSLSVRSRWTRGEWSITFQQHGSAPSSEAPLLRGEWVHDDVCLAYRHNDNPKIEVDRFNMMMQAQARRGVCCGRCRGRTSTPSTILLIRASTTIPIRRTRSPRGRRGALAATDAGAEQLHVARRHDAFLTHVDDGQPVPCAHPRGAHP